MKREDAAAYAADMLERHGLDGWRVTFNTCGPICERYKRSTRAMCCGRCGAQVSYERKAVA